MQSLRVAIVALIVLGGVVCARGNEVAAAPETESASVPRAAAETSADKHLTHAEIARGLDPDSQRRALLPWLAGYCVVIIASSLLGGWIPQWFVLTHNRMQVWISLIGGLMLGIGVFHMLPHALVELGPGGPDIAAHGMMAGLVVMFLLLRAFHFHHHGTLDTLQCDQEACQPALPVVHDHDHDHSGCQNHGAGHSHGHRHGAPPAVGAMKLSWLGVFLGMAFHSVGDGLALGASLQADLFHGSQAWLGVGTFFAVVLHKPIDSISITTLMAASGWSVKSRILVNAAFSLICPVGALLFVLGVQEFSVQQSLIVGIALSVSAGVFICIALGDLLPEMEFHSHNRARLTMALLAGVVIAWGIRFLEPSHAHLHGQSSSQTTRTQD